MIPLPALPLALALGAAPPPCAAPPAGDDPVATWCATVSARPRLPLPTAADRAALRAVLERPALRRARADPTALRRWLAGLWGRFLELLGSAEAERYASVGRLAFVAAGLTALLAALAAARRRRRAGPLAPRRDAPSVAALLPPPDRSAELADAALARGDLLEAVRHAFLSALAALEAAGRLPRDRSLTNAELSARLAAGGGDVAREFSRLGGAFDGAIYGGRRLDEPLARQSVASARRIRLAQGSVR